MADGPIGDAGSADRQHYQCAGVANARKNGNTKAAAKAMAAGFSGHSLRAGFVTTAVRSRNPEYHIRQHSRHKSVQTVEGYIREADKLTDPVFKAIGF